MFLDASAIVAILAGEDDAADLVARIEGHGKPLYYSAVSAFEATISLAKIFALSHGLKDKPIPPPMIQAAQGHISTFFDLIGAEAVAIDAEIYALSVEAASRFGRHVGHPARLNMGDCLAYACCKKYRIPLLFKGNDFTQTDIDRV